MAYRWHKVNGQWERFHWRNFCVAAVIGHSSFLAGWILISLLTTGRWDNRIIEGTSCAVIGLIVTLSWHWCRSRDTPNSAFTPSHGLKGYRGDPPMTVPNLSDVLETASCGGSSIITVIQFLHFYELDPTIGCDKHADVPWFTLWLYAGNVEDVEEDAECGADNECWVKKYAAQLEGVWYDSAKLQLAVDRVVSALREAGYDVLTTSLAGD